MVQNRPSQVHSHYANDLHLSGSDAEDRRQMYSSSFRNEKELYSSKHPYGRVVARLSSQRQGDRLPKLRANYKPGSRGYRKAGQPVLTQETSINAARSISFHKLDNNIQKIIFEHLDYQSLISLSPASHHFHKTAQPELADPQDKFQFVMRAEKDFKQHFPDENNPGNFACYFCYRVLRANLFSEDQANEAFVDCDGNIVLDVKPENTSKYRKVQLRRYCRTCECKFGFDRPVAKDAQLDP